MMILRIFTLSKISPFDYFFSSLCGLWLGQSLFEHLSGIVFVPSIINDLHSGQIAPVGFALIAFLHLG